MVKKKQIMTDLASLADFAPPNKIPLQKGQLVRSIAGRDKDKYYLVLGRSSDMLYLADGYQRGINRLKKKNIRHVQRVNRIAADAVEAAGDRLLRDEEIREALRKLTLDE